MENFAMQLLSLTLKGFRGIRDGLGLAALTLDFEALCDGAELVAIAEAIKEQPKEDSVALPNAAPAPEARPKPYSMWLKPPC